MRIISETKKMIDDKEIAYLKISDDQQKIRYVSFNTSSDKYKVLMENKNESELSLEYLNSRYYRIISRTIGPDKYYLGFSNKSFDSIIEDHISEYKQFLEGKKEYEPEFDILKFEDCSFMETFVKPCATKWEFDDCKNKCRIVLKKTSQEYLENQRISDKITYFDIIEKEKIRKKQFFEAIRYNKEKITCECGAIIRRDYKSTHLKSKKHTDIIDGLKLNRRRFNRDCPSPRTSVLLANPCSRSTLR